MHVLQTLLQSELSFDEIRQVARGRKEALLGLPGLVQHYDLQDPSTGDVSILDVFATKADLEAYLASDLRKSLGRAYRAREAPRVRRFEVFDALDPPRAA